MVTAVIFLLTGVVLPFLMVMQVLQSTIFLNFFSYVVGLIGMIMGVAGTAMYAIKNRHREK